MNDHFHKTVKLDAYIGEERRHTVTDYLKAQMDAFYGQYPGVGPHAQSRRAQRRNAFRAARFFYYMLIEREDKGWGEDKMHLDFQTSMFLYNRLSFTFGPELSGPIAEIMNEHPRIDAAAKALVAQY